MSEEESTAAGGCAEDGEPVSRSVLAALIDAAVEKALTSHTISPLERVSMPSGLVCASWGSVDAVCVSV